MGLLLLIVVVTVPAWLFNQWLLRRLRPRESFRKFLLYLAISLLTAFIYTFIFVWLIGRYLPARPH
ncbi:hypothetical protein [Flaviaesturariibacter amylovorans]|uniref:DUF1146 domain-containing protein n=1 Tax=Flaviaesturariibacter amylovorans TaxID=1084520 RepID=A0ABP8HCD4_9BACT